jgi:hypothetical protein
MPFKLLAVFREFFKNAVNAMTANFRRKFLLSEKASLKGRIKAGL